jgi:hypothetical protein
MTNNVEDLLREGIDRLTNTDADVPATLLHRARRHNRRRRQAITAALATGAAAATAAAVIAATSTSGTNPNALPGQTITYVTTRAERALAQLNPSHAIEQDTLTARNGYFNFTVLNTASSGSGNPQVGGVLSTVRASSEVDWLYQGVLLQQGYSADGKLVYTSTEGPHGVTGAAYPARLRWHNPLTGGQSGPNPPLTCDRAVNGYPNWRQSIKKVLSCHLFSLGGNQSIGGVDTIKLVGKPITAEGETFRQTLWVDLKTYLPLQTSTTFTEPHHGAATLTTDFRWLSPTQANLATLHAAEQHSTIPATFRALPSTDLPLPGFTGPAK